MEALFCESLTRYKRNKTNEVIVGNLKIGGGNPIVVQSMASTSTSNLEASVAQSIRILDAGGQMVRFTACSVSDAHSLDLIRTRLRKSGFNAPLVADVHFNPEAAFAAARVMEKVRINPGNFVDRKSGASEPFEHGLERIREKFIPFLVVCKQNKTAIRIGTNHGSLSPRVVDKYGDTALGMVEATLEFLRLCKQENFDQVVVSLKSSNTRVMVQACRLMVKSMRLEGMNFPMHLGVTEAGDGEDGRIKSAVGIGALLADGIGDTIRVSLTEDPELEIPVAKKIIQHIKRYENHPEIGVGTFHNFDPYTFKRRQTLKLGKIGAGNPPIVVADLSSIKTIDQNCIQSFENHNQKPDFVFLGSRSVTENIQFDDIQAIIDYPYWNAEKGVYPLFLIQDYAVSEIKSKSLNFILLGEKDLLDDGISKLAWDNTAVLVLASSNPNQMASLRYMICKLAELGIKAPVVIFQNHSEPDAETFSIAASIDTGALFLDGLAEGLWLKNPFIEAAKINSISFAMLQACRARISKTEFIACPSCGRTQFDIQKALHEIKQKTSHLTGLKIGVMGCIVNGPGEMADSDYGFVGGVNGRIHLYKGKEMVKQNLDQSQAVDQLVEIIKSNGDWKEKLE